MCGCFLCIILKKLTTEQKNELDPMFKSIMDELDLEKDKNAAVSFEAGKRQGFIIKPGATKKVDGNRCQT